MEISAEKVKELREQSGAGIMDCKKALKKTGGDLAEALDFLRKEGVVRAAKKLDRRATEGLVGAEASPDGRKVALVEINCETDFVARTDLFRDLVRTVALLVIKEGPRNLEALMKERLGGGTVEEGTQALIARVGENVRIRRFRFVEAGRGERIGHYLHTGAQIAAIVKVASSKIDEGTCRDLAMQVAAMHPIYVERNQVPPSVIEKEKMLFRSSPEVSGKPSAIVERIIEGKLSRFFSEVCLVEQPFVKDASGKSGVGAYLKGKDPEARILEMVRFQVGADVETASV